MSVSRFINMLFGISEQPIDSGSLPIKPLHASIVSTRNADPTQLVCHMRIRIGNAEEPVIQWDTLKLQTERGQPKVEYAFAEDAVLIALYCI